MQFSRKRLDEIHARQKSLTKRPQRFDRTEQRTIPQTLPWNATFEDATRQVGRGLGVAEPCPLFTCGMPRARDRGHCHARGSWTLRGEQNGDSPSAWEASRRQRVVRSGQIRPRDRPLEPSTPRSWCQRSSTPCAELRCYSVAPLLAVGPAGAEIAHLSDREMLRSGKAFVSWSPFATSGRRG